MRGTGTVGVTAPQLHPARPGRRRRLRQLQGRRSRRGGHAPLLRVRRAATRRTPSTTTSGSAFGAFPEPFNAPYVRTDNEVLNSQAKGNFVNASGLIKVGDRRSVRVRYQRRRMEDVGFPDFADPYFFNATALPHSNLDRVSARYEAQAVTPWLANLSLTAYYQRTERLLQNALPVQFPAPRRRVLPDQRVPARHLLRDRAAGVDAGRGPAGRDRAREEPPADHGRDVLPRPQQRPRIDQHHHVAGRAGRARARGPGAGGAAGAACSSGRPCPATRFACRTPACATSRCSPRTSGGCGRTCRSSPVCAATSSTSPPRPRRDTTCRR